MESREVYKYNPEEIATGNVRPNEYSVSCHRLKVFTLFLTLINFYCSNAGLEPKEDLMMISSSMLALLPIHQIVVSSTLLPERMDIPITRMESA
jgi:hypothetical protein